MMNEQAAAGISGIVVPDEHEAKMWRVYYQGRLTAPRFAARDSALKYLGALRGGYKPPEFCLAHDGKEVR